MNTCEMFTLRIDCLTASLPRIPSQVVLSFHFGFAMSNTMSKSFLCHAVRDEECIQSKSGKLSSGFPVNQTLSAGMDLRACYRRRTPG